MRLPLVLLAAIGAPILSRVAGASEVQASDGFPYAKAADGHRGFGKGVGQRDLALLFRSAEGEDAAFLMRLFDLEREVQLLATLAAGRYEQRGYFAVLEEEHLAAPREAALRKDVEALHRRFQRFLRDRVHAPMSEASARAFARMLFDQKFRARTTALDAQRSELRRLRGALALFTVHAHGRGELQQGDEIDQLARVADLSAARLRALRLDLQVLYEPAAGARGISEAAEVDALVPLLVRGDGSLARMLSEAERSNLRDVERLRGSLFTPRFDRRWHEVLRQRDIRERRARRSYEEVLRLLPLTDAGRGSTAFDHMKTGDRYRQAAATGAEGLRLDPLHPELHYVIGLALDFFAGRNLSIPHYDRYLALRGVRHWDYRTFSFQELNDMEEYALLAVVGWRPLPRQDE
ncbi:MAG: hypothetical protein V3T22_12990 [Planctomycetota bacterium]